MITADQSAINFCATLLDTKSMEAIESLPIRLSQRPVYWQAISLCTSAVKTSVFFHTTSDHNWPAVWGKDGPKSLWHAGFFPDYGERVLKAQWGQLQLEGKQSCLLLLLPACLLVCLLVQLCRKVQALLQQHTIGKGRTKSCCAASHFLCRSSSTEEGAPTAHRSPPGPFVASANQNFTLQMSHHATFLILKGKRKSFCSCKQEVPKERQNFPFGRWKPLVTQPWLRSFSLLATSLERKAWATISCQREIQFIIWWMQPGLNF